MKQTGSMIERTAAIVHGLMDHGTEYECTLKLHGDQITGCANAACSLGGASPVIRSHSHCHSRETFSCHKLMSYSMILIS